MHAVHTEADELIPFESEGLYLATGQERHEAIITFTSCTALDAEVQAPSPHCVSQL